MDKNKFVSKNKFNYIDYKLKFFMKYGFFYKGE